MTDSIAKQVFDYNVKMREEGLVKAKVPIMPKDVVGKVFTVESHGRPYQSGIVFEDGSELTIGLGGDYYWGNAGEWKSAAPETFKVELNG